MAKKPKRRRLYNVLVDEISLVDEPAVPKAKWLIAKRDEQPPLTLSAIVDELQKSSVEPLEVPLSEEVRKHFEKDGEQIEKADPASVVRTAIQLLSAEQQLPPGAQMALRMLSDLMSAAEGGPEPPEQTAAVMMFHKATSRVVSPKQFKKLALALDLLKQVQDMIGDVNKSAGRVSKAEDIDAEEWKEAVNSIVSEGTFTKEELRKLFDDEPASEPEPQAKATEPSSDPATEEGHLAKAARLLKDREARIEKDASDKMTEAILDRLSKIADRIEGIESSYNELQNEFTTAMGRV